jgi:hypothetical protein
MTKVLCSSIPSLRSVMCRAYAPFDGAVLRNSSSTIPTSAQSPPLALDQVDFRHGLTI